MKKTSLLTVMLCVMISSCTSQSSTTPLAQTSPEAVKTSTDTTKTPPLQDQNPSTSDWLTYRNEQYGYEFQYPSDAKILPTEPNGFMVPLEESQAGTTSEEAYKRWGGEICLTIRYQWGYLSISGPENHGGRYVRCGRTGVGAYEITQQEETVSIDGQKMIAKGMEVKGPGESLEEHNETFRIELPGGVTIEYGAYPDEKATFADYLASKPTLLKILASYHSTRSQDIAKAPSEENGIYPGLSCISFSKPDAMKAWLTSQTESGDPLTTQFLAHEKMNAALSETIFGQICYESHEYITFMLYKNDPTFNNRLGIFSDNTLVMDQQYNPSSGDMGTCNLSGVLEGNLIYSCGGGDGPGGWNKVYVLNKSTGKSLLIKDCTFFSPGDDLPNENRCTTNPLGLPMMPF